VTSDDSRGVLIVSRDWRSRALLRAQLIEDGCPVRAYQTLDETKELLNTAAVRAGPSDAFSAALVVADLFADGSIGELDQLSQIAQRIPVWVIAGRSEAVATELNGRSFERVLFRPVDMRELVEEIRQRLG